MEYYAIPYFFKEDSFDDMNTEQIADEFRSDVRYSRENPIEIINLSEAKRSIIAGIGQSCDTPLYYIIYQVRSLVFL